MQIEKRFIEKVIEFIIIYSYSMKHKLRMDETEWNYPIKLANYESYHNENYEA